jgi:kynurenine---oxoglutarate transaminase / cysteine-S-conjugate beta-lyase / glutamine---phenylpyruvate transaminase
MDDSKSRRMDNITMTCIALPWRMLFVVYIFMGNKDWSSSAFVAPIKLVRYSEAVLYSERVNDLENEQSTKALRLDVDNGESNLSNTGFGEAMARIGNSKPTVWSEFSRIAQEHEIKANLGQGFPDWMPPKFALDSLVEAALDFAQSPHQYTRPAGHPNLVHQLARRYSMHMNRSVNAMSNVAVTVGASQALYLCLQMLLKPGDQVILFEPFFDLYVNQIKLAGGVPVAVPLDFQPYDNDENGDGVTGGEWLLNRQALLERVNAKTKAIILNSPHNPTGKVFTRTEMEMIAESIELASPDCVVLSDEVYKYIVHSPPKSTDIEESLFCRGHVHFAALPGMWDRTITISSAGKTFSATGWQIGWCIGPSRLIARVHQLLPYVQFCASTVMQEALARSLQRADEPYEGHESYYDYLRDTYTRKRNLLVEALAAAGFGVPDFDRTPGGGFFIFARIGKQVSDCVPTDRLLVPNEAAPAGIARLDWALCQWMAEERGILCIPAGPFFTEESATVGTYSDHFVRVAFCKSDDTIAAAATALIKLQEAHPIVSADAALSEAKQNAERR